MQHLGKEEKWKLSQHNSAFDIRLSLQDIKKQSITNMAGILREVSDCRRPF